MVVLNTSKGDTLVGGGESSVYTIQQYNGYYQYAIPVSNASFCQLTPLLSISIDGHDGKPLFWTLTNGAAGTKVCDSFAFCSWLLNIAMQLTLQHANNNVNQLWSLLN